jgi:methylase of polypeptide subunit release factors
MYTPAILVEPITQYIHNKTVWCPFDTANSEFVLALQKNNTVIHTHIKDGYDFFKYEPEHYDVIVSNPPFSKKLDVLNRLQQLGKPYAMLFPTTMLNYQCIANYFVGNAPEMLIPNKKVSFNGKTSSFSCTYFCKDVLPFSVGFAALAHNNTNKYYVPSRMHGDMNFNCLPQQKYSNYFEHITYQIVS